MGERKQSGVQSRNFQVQINCYLCSQLPKIKFVDISKIKMSLPLNNTKLVCFLNFSVQICLKLLTISLAL